jgi:hypothetical protein
MKYIILALLFCACNQKVIPNRMEQSSYNPYEDTSLANWWREPMGYERASAYPYDSTNKRYRIDVKNKPDTLWFDFDTVKPYHPVFRKKVFVDSTGKVIYEVVDRPVIIIK